jgi:hypothetical protein
MRFIYPVLGLGGIVLATSMSSCGLLGGSTPAPTQPIIVTNNIPTSGDSGLTVLLTVAGIGAFLLLIAAVAAVWWALHERQHRGAAEQVVEALTGHPMRRLGLAAVPPISADRLQALALKHETRGELQR